MKFGLRCLTLGVFLLGFVYQRVEAQQTRTNDQRGSSSTAVVEFNIPAAWVYSRPLIAPERRPHDPSHAQKDPTVVFHDGKWHVFMTVKLPERSVIEYCSFANWENADESEGHDPKGQ